MPQDKETNGEKSFDEIRHLFSGGDGSSPAQAILMDLREVPDPDMRHFLGIRLEYAWVKEHYPEAECRQQRLHHDQGKAYDILSVHFPSGEVADIYFNIDNLLNRDTDEADFEEVHRDIPASSKVNFRLLIIGYGISLLLFAGLFWVMRASFLSRLPLASFILLALGIGLVLFIGLPILNIPYLQRNFPLSFLCSVAWVMLVVEAYVIWQCFPGVNVWVDNFSGQDVDLTLNGGPWIQVLDQSSERLIISQDSYTLQVRVPEDGRLLDEHRIDPVDQGPYILNVLGAKTYFSGKVVYGDRLFLSQSNQLQEKQINSRWFKPKAQYLLERPPLKIQIEENAYGVARPVSRTYLLRNSLQFYENQNERNINRLLTNNSILFHMPHPSNRAGPRGNTNTQK